MDKIKVMIHSCRLAGFFPSCSLRGSRGRTLYLRSEGKTCIDRLSCPVLRPTQVPSQTQRAAQGGEGAPTLRPRPSQGKQKWGSLSLDPNPPNSPLPSQVTPSHCQGSPKQEPLLPHPLMAKGAAGGGSPEKEEESESDSE